jgi:hypothetical protein
MLNGDFCPPPKPKRFTDFVSTELLRCHLLKDAIGNVQVSYQIGAVKRMVGQLTWLEKSIKRIARSTDAPWDCRYFGGKTRYWMTKDARDLWYALRNILQSPEELTAGRKLNPHLTLALHLAYKWGRRLYYYSNGDGLLAVGEERPRRMLSHVVNVIRRVCNSGAFRAAVANHYRSAKERYVSCAEYLLDIFGVCGKLLALRVDLYFEGDAKQLSESEEADKAYNKFMRRLSASNIVPDVLGYIGRREDGLDRRIHYHVLVLVDGNLHQQAHNLTEKLGRFWVWDCVGSSTLASFENCYERRHEYRFNCLGLLHYSDDRMLMGLREAVEYMCKEGPHVLLRKGKEKNLRKGQPPLAPREGKRRGAPRRQSDPLWKARLILLTDPGIAWREKGFELTRVSPASQRR